MPKKRSWTDEQLAAAVAASHTYKEVVDRLGIKPGGTTYLNIKIRIDELGLEGEHLKRGHRRRRKAAESQREVTACTAPARPPGARRRWSDDDLRRAVAAATSFHRVFMELDLKPGGSQWIVVRDRILELGLDTSHFDPPLGARHAPGAARMWSDQQLKDALERATSLAEVLRRLDLPESAWRRKQVKIRIEELGLDTSHVRGQRWAKGRSRPDMARRRRPLHEILVEDSDYLNTQLLKRRLIDAGFREARCATCGLDRWNGEPIPLHLDHINGRRRDNRLNNLRLLCPNCHAQTPTYCGRNIGAYSPDR